MAYAPVGLPTACHALSVLAVCLQPRWWQGLAPASAATACRCQPTCHLPASLAETVPLYFGDGSEPAAELDQAVEQLHNDLLDDCTDMKAS